MVVVNQTGDVDVGGAILILNKIMLWRSYLRIIKNKIDKLYMGAYLAKFFSGEVDLNSNGVPDNKELLLLIQNHIKNKQDKKNKKLLKKLLK